MKRIVNWSLAFCAGTALGVIITLKTATSHQNLWFLIACIVLGVSFFAMIVTAAVIASQNKRQKNTAVNYQKKDFILQAGEVYTVQKHGQLRPGQYTVLATADGHTNFNLRVNDYVKSYQHNTTLILAEGDTVSARSGNVILR